MFSWAIVCLIIAAGLFLLTGLNFNSEKDGFASGIFSLVGGIILGIGGSFMLYISGCGEITYPGFGAKEPIYVVCGQVQTSRGTVVITENGMQEVCAFWDKYDESSSGLPPDTKFARITTGDNNMIPFRFVPVPTQ